MVIILATYLYIMGAQQPAKEQTSHVEVKEHMKPKARVKLVKFT
jgi:hypothetical protein